MLDSVRLYKKGSLLSVPSVRILCDSKRYPLQIVDDVEMPIKRIGYEYRYEDH